MLSEETDCYTIPALYIHGWCYYNSRPSRMYTLHTSYIYSIHCQQGNYLKMFSLYHIMQIVAYEHKLPITKFSNCPVQNIQGSELHQWKKGFFPLHITIPQTTKGWDILRVCSETICDLLEEGRQEAAPALNKVRLISVWGATNPRWGNTHQFHVLNNSVNSWMVFRTGLQIIDINIDEKTAQIL